MDQPMPPMPPGAGAPMPPPPGAGPTPDDVAAAQMEAEQGSAADLQSQAPIPESGGIPVDVIEDIATEIDDIIAQVNKEAGADLVPPLKWAAPEGVKAWTEQIPGPIFGGLVVLSQAAAKLEGGKFKKLSFDPSLMVNSGGARKTFAALKKIGRDKKFIKALAEVEQQAAGGPPPGAAPEGPPPPPPTGSQMPDDSVLLEAV